MASTRKMNQNQNFCDERDISITLLKSLNDKECNGTHEHGWDDVLRLTTSCGNMTTK
jgi:hypothetical protein